MVVHEEAREKTGEEREARKGTRTGREDHAEGGTPKAVGPPKPKTPGQRAESGGAQECSLALLLQRSPPNGARVRIGKGTTSSTNSLSSRGN